jgi:4-diphosphocytidyl-2-C-methyl-D-erythritol kinase
MAGQNIVRVNAHAKINLHLGILRRRADGYHDVETVLQTLAVHDTLTCEIHDGPFGLRCDRAGVPVDASNLVWRAAALLAEAAGRGALAGTRTRITIEKRIPMQAGLGGGSADAAAALLALVRLWQLEIEPGSRILHDIAARLGADVPFFLEGGTALGTGRGDELRALPEFPASAVLIVMPPFGVPTADAYRWHDAGGAGSREIGRWPEQPGEWRDWLSRCRNDFEAVVGERYPEVPETIDRLRAAGASLAALSGSGAAMFGLFETAAGGESAARTVARTVARPGWQVIVTKTLTATLNA